MNQYMWADNFPLQTDVDLLKLSSTIMLSLPSWNTLEHMSHHVRLGLPKTHYVIIGGLEASRTLPRPSWQFWLHFIWWYYLVNKKICSVVLETIFYHHIQIRKTVRDADSANLKCSFGPYGKAVIRTRQKDIAMNEVNILWTCVSAPPGKENIIRGIWGTETDAS